MTGKKQNNKALPLPKQGEIWLVEFPPTKETRKPIRPCLMISDNIQNQYGKWIAVIPLTTEDIENIEPFEVFVEKTEETGIDKSSKLKFNYPQTIDRERLKEHLGVLSGKRIGELRKAWQVVFDSESWDW